MFRVTLHLAQAQLELMLELIDQGSYYQKEEKAGHKKRELQAIKFI